MLKLNVKVEICSYWWIEEEISRVLSKMNSTEKNFLKRHQHDTNMIYDNFLPLISFTLLMSFSFSALEFI